MERLRTNPRWLVGVLAVTVVLSYFAYRCWTRPPVVAYANLRCIQLLMTAVSSRNSGWVDKVESAIGARYSEGKMSDAEIEPFRKVIATARAGEWEQSHRQCFDLAEAQLGRRRSPQVNH